MGKHKDKSKKSKKHKKEKRSKSSNSSDSDNEIVWAESGTTEATNAAESSLPASNSETKSSKIEDIFADDFDDDDEEEGCKEDKTEVNEDNDWIGIIQKTSKGNIKQAQIKRTILKREQESADNKVRYARELNSYYRDDTTRKFIEDPDKYWKSKKESVVESESDSNDQDEDSDMDTESTNPVATRSFPKLTDSERNAINAKILKAEILGNTELVTELKAKLKERDDNSSEAVEEVHYAKRKTKAEKQAEEENMSVKQMYFQSKSISSREEAMRFVASSSKLRTNDDEYEEVRGKKKKIKVYDARFDKLRSDEQDSANCSDCFEKLKRHLVFKFATELKHCFVCFTPFEPFTANYCQIRGRSHASNNSVGADEECWNEVRQVMRLLSSFFAQIYKCSVVFMETYFMQQKRSQNLSRRHFVIECVPIKERLEEDARIYFNNAIRECEKEWSMNKKLIKLEEKSVTKMIPKGLPYFWVSFGANFKGYAHVIEDEDYFSKDFGKEVIGGLRDIEPSRWRRPKFQDYDAQIKRVTEMKDKWNNFIKVR